MRLQQRLRAPLGALLCTALCWAPLAIAQGAHAAQGTHAAHAQMTIYRCTDPAGNVTFQNDKPCPKGHAQLIREVVALPSHNGPPPHSPAAAAAVAKPAAAKPAPEAAATTTTPSTAAATPPQAPPALFQCRTWDDRDYLGETAEPAPSCMPLQTVGIDGSTDNTAGSACEMRQDTCTAVDAEQLCRAWKKRVDEAEFRWKFAGGKNDERKAEYGRLIGIYNGSTCAR